MSEIQEPLSRRRVLRAVAIGAGAAAASAALPAQQAAAEPVFTGDVVLGAIPVTFVGAPLNNRGSTSWQVTRQRTDTIRLSATADQTLSISLAPLGGDGYGLNLHRQKFKFRKTISAGPSTSPIQFVNPVLIES